jgi:hypothetical protein
MVIGAAFNGPSHGKPTERLRAMLDELVIYDRALAPAEIRALAARAADAEALAGEPQAAAGPAGAEAVAGKPGFIWAEAEAGAVTAPLEVRQDPGASQGRYIAVAPGITSKGSAPASGQSTIGFQVPAAGTFKIWGRVITPTTAHDSFWVRMDRGPWIKWNDITVGSAWHWAEVHQDDADRVSTFALTPGPHTLTVAYREDGAQLDRLLLTSDLGATPTGAP